MKFKNTASIFLILFLGVGTLVSSGLGTEGQQGRLTVEMLFDRDFQDSLNVPRFSWTRENSALLLDSRVAEEDRSLEIFDPKTGGRKPALDRAKFLSELKTLLGEKAPEQVEWPDAVHPEGKAVAYIISGDIFLVQIPETRVMRLTRTRAEESAADFSPDGECISFIRGNDLYAITLATRKERRLTFGATETLLNGPLSWVYSEEIYGFNRIPYKWSPDSKAISFLQTDETPVSISTFVNFEPATQGVVQQRYPKAGQRNPRVRLGIVDVYAGNTTWVDCGIHEYLARFEWLPSGREIAVQTLNRNQSELKLMFASRETGKARLILEERQPAWINLHDGLYFFQDGKRFLWLSERDGYQHLYLYRTDGKLLAQITRGEFMVIPSDGALTSGNGGLVAVDEKAGWAYFTSNKQALKSRDLFRVKLDGTGLKLLSQREGVHSAVFSPNLEYYFEVFSSASTPPELILHRTDGTREVTVTPPAKAKLEAFNPIFPEFQTFRTDDGLELPVMITKPRDFSADKKYPAIVYVYGGPGSQQVVDRWRDRWLWNSILSEEGFAVFVFEVRSGVGKSKALETSVYGRAYGMQNVKDILAGVHWLSQTSWIDSSRLGIWGWSGGGCTTLYTMTHSDVFKAAIAVAPVSDWHFYDTIYTERYQGTPQQNPEGYKETSSVLAASNLKGRLLIVHGTYDDNVHPQNTYAFINELIKHSIPFELMIYPWRMHGISDKPARIHLYNLMLDFWKRNLNLK